MYSTWQSIKLDTVISVLLTCMYTPYVVNIIFRKELINLVLLSVFTHTIVYFYGLQYILYKGHPQLS